MIGNRLILTALAATIALGATALPSLARDHRGPAPAERGFVYLLKNADANKDGKITEEEVVAFQGARFGQIDINSDGVVTPGEFSEYRKAKMAAFKAEHPERQKGKMTENDNKPNKKRLGKKNKMAENDQRPNKPHRLAMNDRRRPDKTAEGSIPRGEKHRGGKHMRGPGNMERIFFTRADTDKSGQVSRDEFAIAAEKMFVRLDSNGDMVVTVEDIPNRPMR